MLFDNKIHYNSNNLANNIVKLKFIGEIIFQKQKKKISYNHYIFVILKDNKYELMKY